jgi:hypothetical protein
MCKVKFSSDLSVRRIQWQEIAIKEAGIAYDVAAAMSMVELRDIVDELYPTTITNTSLSASGGKSVRVTVLKAKSVA